MSRLSAPPAGDTAAYFTISELSTYSRIGESCLYRAISNKEMRHSRIGKKIIIARTDFEAWLKKRTKMSLNEIPRLPFSL